MNEELDRLAIHTVRGLSMDAVQAANSGHPGTPMALAPLGWAIFTKLRRHDPQQPNWIDRDRFVLSCGHASMLQYSLLHLTGYDVTLDDIKAFRQWGSKTPGHPEVFHTPGVEITTGPLGQGFATAVGMAMAERHLAARFNRPGFTLFDHHVFVIASDGDVMEGVSAEAASMAGHMQLGKLVVFWDDNEITIDGRTDLTFTEDTMKRFESYGWHVESVDDGEDVDALVAAAARAKADPRPSFIRVKTIIGFPAPNKRDKSAAHGSPLGAEEIAGTKEIMGWPSEPFHVPELVAAAKTQFVEHGAALYREWSGRLAGYREAHPKLAGELDQALAGEFPDVGDSLPQFTAGERLATRAASGKVLTAITKEVRSIVGGSADLEGSNKTRMHDYADFRPGQEGIPQNVYYGIREHAMAAAVNGMALHGGVVPFGATFLVFSDYMRPALRLGSLMGLKTRYVFTHDSIGLGEDGPTHQPVEHLAALRAIPNFTVLRPSDANETRVCWEAMLACDGPAAIVLTRQKVLTHGHDVNGARHGGYVLREPKGVPDVILIGTGSEVELALRAADALMDEGVRARVVSMPSVDLFEQQASVYQDSVLPPAIAARVVVEAGISMGWHKYVGRDGGFVTLDRFGASAPYEVLYEQFGITAEAVVAEAKRTIARLK